MEKRVFLEKMVLMEKHLKYLMFLQERKKILDNQQVVVFQNHIRQRTDLLMEN
jgi:hypothetical protein